MATLSIKHLEGPFGRVELTAHRERAGDVTNAVHLDHRSFCVADDGTVPHAPPLHLGPIEAPTYVRLVIHTCDDVFVGTLMAQDDGDAVVAMYDAHTERGARLTLGIQGMQPDGSHYGPNAPYPEYLRDAGVVAGPMLRFVGEEEERWLVDAMLVLADDIGGDGDIEPPVLHVVDEAHDVAGVVYHKTTRGQPLVFVRYRISVVRGDEERRCPYTLLNGPPLFFRVPALRDNARLLFWTCNGYLTKASKARVGPMSAMWRQINALEEPHLSVSGGDFLYLDGYIGDDGPEPPTDDDAIQGLWACCPSLTAWKTTAYNMLRRESPDTADKLMAEFSDETRCCVYSYAYDAYCRHMTQRAFWLHLATTPTVVSRDDHETFDGEGSYPMLNDSVVMHEIRAVLRDVYRVVLQQSAPDVEERVAVRFDAGRTLLLVPDTRRDRTARRIISPSTYETMHSTLERAATDRTERVLVVLPISPLYPRHVCLEQNTLYMLQREETLYRALLPWIHRIVKPNLPTISSQIAASHEVEDRWDPVEDADDELVDRWTHPNHLQERDAFLINLLAWRARTTKPVFFLSGDVHHALWTRVEDPDTGATIDNVISSPVGNHPTTRGEARTFLVLQHLNKYWTMCTRNHDPFNIHIVTKQLTDATDPSYPLPAPDHLITKRNYVAVQCADRGFRSRLMIEAQRNQTPRILTMFHR